MAPSRHNNIRMMWHGLFDQGMADSFVARHLMNESEFFTKMPLPSISVADPRYQNTKGNSWSGPPEGLTLQRAVRALENYGHYAESVLIGDRLTEALRRSPGCPTNASQCRFGQQIDAMTGIPEPSGNCYGPMILAFTEYTTLRYGVAVRPDVGAEGQLWWSALPRNGASSNYTQTLADARYTLRLGPAGAVAERDGRVVFASSTGGARFVTDLAGTLTAVVGIADRPQRVCVVAAPAQTPLCLPEVRPNEQWALAHGPGGELSAKLARSVAFVAPHSS